MKGMVLIMMEVIRPPLSVLCAKMVEVTFSLLSSKSFWDCFYLEGCASLLEMTVTFMALLIFQTRFPFVHYGLSVEKMFKPPE